MIRERERGDRNERDGCHCRFHHGNGLEQRRNKDGVDRVGEIID